MAKLHQPTLFLLILLCVTIMMPNPVLSKKTKPKKLDFYMLIIPQNTSLLNNPKADYTAVQSAAAVTTQPFAFGTLHTFDNPLSKTMSLANPADVLGRVQGWYGNCGQEALTLCLAQTFTYNDGEFNGTFSLVGADIATDPVKYAPIVGGTGSFAFCRGVSKQQRVSSISINDEEHDWFLYSVQFKYVLVVRPRKIPIASFGMPHLRPWKLQSLFGLQEAEVFMFAFSLYLQANKSIARKGIFMSYG